MTDDKWQEIIEMAQNNFRGAKISSEDLIMETPEGPKIQGNQDVLEFKHPSGDKYRLVRENRPVVLEKKELYSHRGGSAAQAQYKFSQTEFSHRLRVFKEVNDEWEEVTLDRLGL